MFKRLLLCLILFLTVHTLYAQFPAAQPVKLTDIGNNWYPDYDLFKDLEPRKVLVDGGILTDAQFNTAKVLSTPANMPAGFKNRNENYAAFYKAVQSYKAYYLGEWDWMSADGSYKQKFALVWVPAGENSALPQDVQPTSADGLFMIMNPASLIGVNPIVKNKSYIKPEDVAAANANRQALAKSTTTTPKPPITKDPKAPKGPAYDAVVAAYLKNAPDEVAKKLPALEKIYPVHLHTAFFKVWVADQTEQDADAALRGYSEIIRKDSTFADAFVFRSKAFWNKGLDDRAIADISTAIRLQGANAPAYYYTFRADYYNSVKNFTEALADFKQAITQAPSHPANYIGFMNVAFAASKNSQAEQLLTTALNGTQVDNGDLHLVYGDFLLRSQRFRESDAAFTKALSMPGVNPSGADYNSASIAAYKLKNYSKAIILSEKALALMPKKIDFMFNRASIAIDQQQWEVVYQWAQKALALDANSAYANMLMAIGVKRTGRGDALSAEYEAKAKRLSAAGN